MSNTLATPPENWIFTRWTRIDQLEALEIHHPDFKARLFFQGAQLTSFTPTNEPDWLWVSQQARYETGRAIRGGIPVCWPWFGVADKNPPDVKKHIVSGQAHGFARTEVWKLEQVIERSQSVEVSLSLDVTDDFACHWQCPVWLIR